MPQSWVPVLDSMAVFMPAIQAHRPEQDCDCGSQPFPQDLIGFLSRYKKCVMQAAVQTSNPGLVALNQWCKRVGLAPITAWRFRKRGWLRTVNIAGRTYITDQAITEFTQRAEAGEFAREHKVPCSCRLKNWSSASFSPATRRRH